MGETTSENTMKLIGLTENPFSFRILPELFVGHIDEINQMITSIKSGTKLSLLLGPTGSGKTTMMKYMLEKLPSNNVLYLPKPPKNPEDWVDIFTNFIGLSLWERLTSRKRNLNLYNISEWMNKKINRDVVLFVDEGHEATIETLEWLRTITDQVDKLCVVLAGLPSLEDMLKEKLETFIRRVSVKIELTNLSKSETRELIKRRIEWAGGEDIKPFTSDAVEFIYEKTGGFPRDVLRMCDNLIHQAIRKGITTIDMNFLKENMLDEEIKPQRITKRDIDYLPAKQRTIIEILQKEEDLTPSEIVSRMGTDNYKSLDNAIRSVNNILKRLLKEGYIERKGKGKSYRYRLSSKTRTLFVNA